MLHQKHESYQCLLLLKNWVYWITTKAKKFHNMKNIHFEKKCPKIKKHIIFPLITIFYNFALKLETSWAKKVVKPILETWNAVNDVTVYVWFICSLIKIFGKTIWLRKCQVTSSRCEEVILLEFHLQIWGEWPIWLRRCNQNQKVPASIPTRRSAGLRDSTSLQRSRWPSGRKCKNAVMNIEKVRLSPP